MISSVAEIIRTQAKEHPGRTAIEYEGRSITFGALDSRSNQVANALRSLGIGEQERVAFVDKNCPEYFEVAFGVAKINGINLGVNWRLTPDEMAHVINDAQVSVLVVGDELFAPIEAIEDRLPTVKAIVALAPHDRWIAYETWVDGQPDVDPGVMADDADVAFLIYTSGTTGLPKGAIMTNRGFAGAFTALDQWRLDGSSVSLAMMPMFHFAGSGWSLLSLGLGCRTVLLRDVDPVRILQAIPEFGVTNIVMPPSVIQFLLMTPGVEETDFSSLKAILYGGSPITETVLAAATDRFDCDFIQIYGLTETAGCVAQLDGADHDPAGKPHLMRSCGRAYPWVELRVVDPETGADRPTGQPGELWIRAAQNSPGYWNHPEATAAAITPDGWLRTGDIGSVDADGYIFLSDRVHDMIVSGAENVYPTEVENALSKHPAVADVAVIGVPDDRWGEAVKAVVVLAAGATADAATADEIIAATRQHLAGYKLPKSIDFVEELPRNLSGKVLRRVLREPHWKGHARAIG
jgi:long-chain acyl-CoA synthetase